MNRKAAAHRHSTTSDYLLELIRRERDIKLLREKLLAPCSDFFELARPSGRSCQASAAA